MLAGTWRRMTIAVPSVSAQDETGAEFVGGIDFEAVFSGSVCHSGNFGDDGGVAICVEFLDYSGVEAGTDDRVVDEGLPRFELPGGGQCGHS